MDILGSICLFIYFNNNVASLAPRPSLKHVNTPSTLSDQSLHFSLPVGAFNSFFLFLDRYVEHILLTQVKSVAFRAFHKQLGVLIWPLFISWCERSKSAVSTKHEFISNQSNLLALSRTRKPVLIYIAFYRYSFSLLYAILNIPYFGHFFVSSFELDIYIGFLW